ncbi:MAG: hypothetical protein P8Y27_04100 [Chromatiaceae bacterium]|jgi:hypothetical protein
MRDKNPIYLFASAAALTLALCQGAEAGPVTSVGPATSAAKAPPPQTPAAQTQGPQVGAGTPSLPSDLAAEESQVKNEEAEMLKGTSSLPSDAAAEEARIQKKEAEMLEERERRYQDLRKRAAEIGLELPATPPWEQAGIAPPEMPMPPTKATPPWKPMSAAERQKEWEDIRNMTPEEREAKREQRWQAMRKRAKAQGVDLPETPPWKEAKKRREAMRAKWQAYQKIVDGLTPEQKEAARAVFGSGGRRAMPPAMPMEHPCGPGYRGPGAMPPGSMMPGYGEPGAGPSMFQGRPTAPWYYGGEPSREGPPPPTDYSQPW